MPKKTQLNIRVPAEQADRLRADARRSGRSLDAVMETIIGDFLSGWTVSERKQFYSTKPIKKAGRPLEQEAA